MMKDDEAKKAPAEQAGTSWRTQESSLKRYLHSAETQELVVPNKTSSQEDPNYESKVRASFARQKVMQTIGATMTRIDPGVVEIVLPYNAELTQQTGFIHAGIVSTIMDSACGYAAFTLMPADSAVLTVEFKVNLLSPARGELIRVRSEVKRAGQNITVCSADAWAVDMGQGKLVATMLATVMCVRGRNDLVG